MTTTSPDYLGYSYAGAVALGGVAGFAKAGSLPSLAAGLFFGAVLGFGAFRMSKNPNDYYVMLAGSTILGAVMASRYYKSRKFMPAGLIATMSLLMIARIGFKTAIKIKA